MKVLMNAINNGTTVLLTGNRVAVVRDGMKNAMTRMVEVISGAPVQEMGSIYIFDIVKVKIDDAWYDTEMTERQRKRASEIKNASSFF